MKLTIVLTMTAALVMLSAAGIFAKGPHGAGQGPAVFSSYDQDKSGTISEQEFNAARERHHAAVVAAGGQGKGRANAPSFADIDTNKDGQISSQELEQMQATRGMGRGQHGQGKGGAYN